MEKDIIQEKNKKIIRGYKIFNSDWTCRDVQYSCPGEFTVEGELKLCRNGIHFCTKLIDCYNYYEDLLGNHCAEVEALGEVITNPGDSKCCTNKLRIIRELTTAEIIEIVTREKTEAEIIDKNWGRHNIGKNNVGARNIGDENVGECNFGNYNYGYCNCGCYNDGTKNTGDSNIGTANTGVYNRGNGNLGFFNCSWDGAIGAFNTKLQYISMFNKPTTWTVDDVMKSSGINIVLAICNSVLPYERDNNVNNFINVKDHFFEQKKTQLTLADVHRRRQAAWHNLNENLQNDVLDLPNFDADIFKQCTGIDVSKEIERRKNGR